MRDFISLKPSAVAAYDKAGGRCPYLPRPSFHFNGRQCPGSCPRRFCGRRRTFLSDPHLLLISFRNQYETADICPLRHAAGTLLFLFRCSIPYHHRTQGKSADLTIEFNPIDFHHLMGLGKLKDLRIAVQNRESVFRGILNGTITYSSISCSPLYRTD